MQISLTEMYIWHNLHIFYTVLQAGLPCVIADPDPDSSQASFEVDLSIANQVTENLITGQRPPAQSDFRPEFVRLPPPLHVCEDELAWLNPTDVEHTVAWDSSMCVSNTSSIEVKKLMAKAFKGRGGFTCLFIYLFVCLFCMSCKLSLGVASFF